MWVIRRNKFVTGAGLARSDERGRGEIALPSLSLSLSQDDGGWLVGWLPASDRFPDVTMYDGGR